MQIRPLIAVLMLLVLLVAGWSFWKSSESPERAAPVGEPPPAAPDRGEALAAPLEAPELPRQPAEAPAPAAVAPPAPELGTIVVLDEQGQEHAAESGSFEVWIVGKHPSTIEVTAGTWSAPFPQGSKFSVTRIVLGGRTALSLPSSGPFVVGAHPPALRCQWTRTARLHVVDAASGAELDAIRLYTVPAFDAMGFEPMLQRPKEGLIGEDLVSPIEITHAAEGFGQPMHFAHRAGYAWGSIQIDPNAGGDFVLELEPGGELRVTVTGSERDARLRLRLLRKQATEIVPVAKWTGAELERGPPPRLDLEGLAVGDYVVRAEIGDKDKPTILAERECTITAGVRTDVELAIEALPKPNKIEVVVTVQLDPLWELEEFRVWIEPLSAEGHRAGQADILRTKSMNVVEPGTWVSRGLPMDEGRYRFTLQDAKYFVDVLVGPDPRQQVLLAVPAPCRVLVHAVDEDTGQPIPGASYMWGWKATNEKELRAGGTASRETAPGQLELRSPPGFVEVEAKTSEHTPTFRVIEVGPGLTEVTLTLSRNYRMNLVLREGEAVVPWTMRAMSGLRVEPIAGTRLGDVQGMSFTEGRLSINVPKAGVYRIRFPDLAGYHQLEPIEVNVDQHSMPDLVIPIVRQ